jgi:hypothetical protein
VLAVTALGSGSSRYLNSVHEVLLERLRLALGEEPISVRVSFDFSRYWVQSIRPSDLWESVDPPRNRLMRIESDTNVLVLAPQQGDWIWVYVPGNGQKGYLRNRDARKIGPPAVDQSDAELRQLLQGSAAGPVVQRANAWLRGVSWALFGAFWLVAAWRATTLREFLIWSTVVMLALYWIAASWFWPWYVIWALALAALIPASRPAQLAALVSASALTLYTWFGLQDTSYEWLFAYRSLIVFGAPLVLFGLAQVMQRIVHSLAARTPTSQK